MPSILKLLPVVLVALLGAGPDTGTLEGTRAATSGMRGSAAVPAASVGVPSDSLPAVHLLATGGTISNTEGDRLTGEELVREIPALGNIATLSVEQFSNVASGSISLEQWLAMSRRINELFASRPELAGVVVTHGTDTMEETVFFLDLTLAHCRPVVVTGAMRRASMPGADGPANLLNAVRLAADPGARDVGAVLLMNDEVFAARSVAKVHTSRMNAFAAADAGPIGVADPDAVVLSRPSPPRSCGTPAFDLSGIEELPRVDIVTSYLGSDGALVRAAVAAGARGVVMATVGRGGSTPGERDAVREAREAGVIIVRSSRTGAGRVPVGGGGGGPAGEAELAPSLGAGDLTPVKARILLMLALATNPDVDADALRALFDRP
jgi:L-asparaginase